MNFARSPFALSFLLAMVVTNAFSFTLAQRSFGLFLDIPAHEAPVYALAFSPDGTKLASAGADQSIAIWDTDTWTLSLRIKSDSAAIHALSFSPDGSILAAGSDNGTVHVWNTATWSNPKVISAHGRDVRAIAFSRDGTRLVTAGRDKRPQPEGLFGRARSLLYVDKTDDVIKVWNTSQWSLSRKLPPLTSRVVTLSFNPTKNLLASGEENGAVVILNAETWQTTKRLRFQHAPLKKLIFNYNGTRLLGGGEKRGLTVWKTADWAVLEDSTLKVRAVDYDSNKNQIASGSRNGTVTLFSNIGAKTSENVQNNLKFGKPINVIRFSPDGQVLVIGGDKGTIRVAQPLLPIPLLKSLVAPSVTIPIPLIVANFDLLLPIPTPASSVTPLVPIPVPFVTSSFDEPLGVYFVSFFIVSLIAVFWLRHVSKVKARAKTPNKEINRALPGNQGYRSPPPENRGYNYAPTPKNRGYVYLLKAGPYYKIGKSKDVSRRVKQIKLQLPYEAKEIHVVLTDNMTELETDWHRHFKAKRANGEWFMLSDLDVKEFMDQPSLSESH